MRIEKFTTKFQQALADAQSLAVGGDQQFVKHGGFVRLSSGQMEVQRQSVAVAEDVDFRREAPAGTA